ncbi:MAG: hypothetical protein ACW964_04660 [Candidatus Hodarchaeales archaeon]
MKTFYCKIGFIQFPIFTILANLIHTDYSFNQNFLSDLGRISNINGNIISLMLFALSLIILGLSLILFYSDNNWGILSGIGFICVALFPIDIFPFFHMVFAILAFVFLTVATVRAELRILTGVLIAFFFNFLITESLMIQVLNQKFAFYSMVIMHLFCLYNVSFFINRYYRKIKRSISFSLEENSILHENKIVYSEKIIIRFQNEQ